MVTAFGLAEGLVAAQAAAGPAAEKGGGPGDADPPVQLVRVPLPVTGEVDRRVQTIVEELLTQWQQQAERDRRPILVLEFRGGGESGSTSQFERALSLARYLSGGQLARVRTVAWLTGSVQGHAVLPVLACESIIAAPDAELGRAGVSETHVDDTVRAAYREMAERRRTIPLPWVLGMLDPNLGVYRLQTLDGARYALEEDVDELKQQVVASEVQRVVPPGEMANLSGAQLRLEFGFASHMARDRSELAAALQIRPGSIQEDPTLGQGRRPLRVDVFGTIRTQDVNWIERNLREQLSRHQANFVCVVIDSPGGSPQDSLRLASYLASLDGAQVRTVAFVPEQARSDAALIALACDQLVIGEQAVLGGPGDNRSSNLRPDDLLPGVREIAADKQQGWSLMMAMVDQELVVRRYARQGTGATRYFSETELAEQQDAEQWQTGSDLPTASGLRGWQALEAGLAVTHASEFADFQSLYHLEDEIPTVRPSWAHRAIEFLATPHIAGALLFIGWFALMFELMSPGVGLPGFVSAVCFLIFFWSSVLHGTAGWLEILLFATGIVCIGLEIFVLPGIGAFGIGGGLLIVASIVLASQTFVVPSNDYEWSQFPDSLLVISAAGAGILAAMACMRQVLTRAPVFRRVALETPDGDQQEQIRYHESLVHLDYLAGKRGVATTQLTPSGKARFGDEVIDVISDGDLIPAGSAVSVAEVRGNEVIVRLLDG